MNDPRLTDYALGELDPAAREAFERELAGSTELQNELKETIALIEALPAAVVTTEAFTDGARETLRRRAIENFRAARQNQVNRRRMFVAGIGALAAGFAATVIVISNHRDREPFPLVVRESAAISLTPPAVVSAPTASAKASPPVAQNQPIAKLPAEQLEIEKSLLEGENFFKTGRYDLAYKRSEQVLQLDKDNIPARRLMEKVTSSRNNYAATAENSTRNELVASVSKAWQVPSSAAQGRKDLVGGAATGTVPREIPNPETAAVSRLPRTPASIDTVSVADAGAMDGRSFRLRMRYGLQQTEYTASLKKSESNTEAYDAVKGNAFLDALSNPLSTFSVDVDTASYANLRRFLNAGQLPPEGAVRIEELVNYFPYYSYPQPEGDAPFSVNTEVSHAPWEPQHLLARIALKGRDTATDKLPPSNLVFLIDVSGSMDMPDKLPLLKRSLSALVKRLSLRDRVAIVTYAGNSGLAFPSTTGEDKARILEAIDELEPGGSTNGAEGIELAYEIARKNFLAEGNNRVILCTDGDFNVGVTSREELTRLIERERKSGVFLSVLGFGTGNLKDAAMENLADKGNGNYAYIDSPSEGRKVLVEQMGANLFTIAKDVKIQVEFNPAKVAAYRLIGYENRLLAKEDFNDDKKDAGEIGAGHTVTALYEIVPAGQDFPHGVDPLKYQAFENRKSKIENSPDLFTVKLRFKAPDGDKSKLIVKTVGATASGFDDASEDFRFASAVAAFGMKLRAADNDASLDWNAIQKIARGSLGEDPGAYRAEFLTLIEKARQLSPDEK